MLPLCILRASPDRSAAAWRKPRIGRSLLALVAVAHLTPGLLAAQSLEEICTGELAVFPLPPFPAFDLDEDSLIDEREAEACHPLAEVFSTLDIDSNDVVTIPEYQSFVAVWSQRQRSFEDVESLE